MLRRVQKYIRDEQLLHSGDRVLVCVSGGADSVALLDILLRGGYSCVVAHCNFHLRGEESMRDEVFVRKLCLRQWANEIPLIVRDFDTVTYSKTKNISIEMAARELRYAWFAQVAEAEECAAIAVAHHQNDQAETLLLNLFRGTGIRGLCGMRPKSRNPYQQMSLAQKDIPIIRPLLCTTRDYIEYYLQDKRRIPWVTDSTNSDTTIARNAIRAILAERSKAEIENIAKTAQRMQGYVDWLDGEESRNAGIAKLYEQLRTYDFPEIDKMYDALQRGEGGKTFYAPHHIGTIQHKKLQITSKT